MAQIKRRAQHCSEKLPWIFSHIPRFPVFCKYFEPREEQGAPLISAFSSNSETGFLKPDFHFFSSLYCAYQPCKHFFLMR